MDIYFRALTTLDIPIVKHITKDIWEGDDYVPKLIAKWLQAEDENVNFGVFRDSQMRSESLVGMGRIKWLSPSKVWIEGGRIDPKVQKQGIGLQMTQFTIDYARTHGAKIIQYDTHANREHLGDPAYPQNHGSIVLARKLGFMQKDYVDVLELEVGSNFCFPDSLSENGGSEISCAKAFIFFQQLPPGIRPTSEINQGWSFIPFEWDFFQPLYKKYRWEHNQKAIAQITKLHTPSQETQETFLKEELWIIVYGAAGHAKDLVLDILKRKILNLESHQKIQAQIFCSPAISEELVSVGFHFSDGKDSPSGVMLFEKAL